MLRQRRVQQGMWFTVQEGLGSSSGISLLFARMRKLTWGMTTYKSGEFLVLLFSQTQIWAATSGAP